MTYSVLRRIEELAFDQGDRVAMEEGQRRLTYAGLYEAIRRAGRQGLARSGSGLVGINGRPSIEAGVGILAAMASGDVAVPVDGRLPLARQQAPVLREHHTRSGGQASSEVGPPPGRGPARGQ